MKTKFILTLTVAAAVLLAAVTGCDSSNTTSKTSPSAKQLASALKPSAAAKPTLMDVPVPPKPAVTAELLEHGKKLYGQNCLACHGTKGDGNGDAAAFLLPKPRDFVDANYRLRTTATGKLPTDEDLYRSVSFGMTGTPMPGWKHFLSEDERWAVVEYIKTFSPKFSDTTEERQPVVALNAPLAKSESILTEGRELYSKLACITCHGDTGRGDGSSAASLLDDKQMKIKPRDLTKPSGFKAGYATKEIVRTILTGFNGTPMLGFHGTISEADAWKLAYYVETMARPTPPSTTIVRASQNFLEREQLGEPDVRIKLTERAWKFDPAEIRVKKGQIVEITFEPTDNGLGVGHGFAISSYDEAVFLNGVMAGTPKTVKFRADRAGQFTFYCATQCSTEKLHPLMNGTFIVEDGSKKTASLE
ncbi:MAG TPA: c-type cytochrome [Verrucomicrobiae bacterium]|nr:c-type cytochrome [Verrucomicrobiae bacterium]